MNFHQTLQQSSVSHAPSEIILICWFDAQETVFIIHVKNSMNKTFKWTEFIWNINIF